MLISLVAVLVAEVVCRAIRRADMTEQQFAQELGISPQQWHQQKRGVGHISLTRIAEKAPRVMAWISFIWLLDHGVPPEVAHAQPIVTAIQTEDRRSA